MDTNDNMLKWALWVKDTSIKILFFQVIELNKFSFLFGLEINLLYDRLVAD